MVMAVGAGLVPALAEGQPRGSPLRNREGHAEACPLCEACAVLLFSFWFLACSFRRFNLDSLPNFPGQFRKARRIKRRHLRQHFSVEDNSQLLEAKNKLAVGELVQSCGRSDAGDPEAAKIPLASFTVAVGKLARAIRGLLHGTIKFTLG